MVDRTGCRGTAAADTVSRVLLENVEQGVFILSPNGSCWEVNQRMAQWLGRPVEELLDQPLFDLFPEPTDAYHAALGRARRGERVELEKEVVGAGDVRTLKLVLVPFREGQEEVSGVLCLCSDLTEERRRAEELRQARELVGVERSAVGLTHDLRNLLTVIRGHLDLLTACPDPEVRQELEPLIAATERAMELSSLFLSTAREQVLGRQALDLNHVLLEVATLLRPQLGPGVTLEVWPYSPLPLVPANAGQLSRLLLNLCLNALTALAGSGRLRLETEVVRLGTAEVVSHPRGRSGLFVSVSVTDTGPGLPPQVQARLYDLFQRGGSEGEGFGVGLAVVAGIAAQHEGWLECDSTPGQGTCFRVYLPALDSTAETKH